MTLVFRPQISHRLLQNETAVCDKCLACRSTWRNVFCSCDVPMSCC